MLKFTRMTAAVLLSSTAAWAAQPDKIDLVEFGRVVELPDVPAAPTTEANELPRGAEGWDAIRGSSGQYTIGVEWDEPVDIVEVNIEFRHAIANREQIKAQYWKVDPPAAGSDRGTRRAESGRWMTPEVEWWAGDRDVSFSFLPRDREAPDAQPAKPARRTTRLRFICGKEDLPPVRYLRAYGPDPVTNDTFDLRLEPGSRLTPPVALQVDNGFILGGDGRTRMTSAVMRDSPQSYGIIYARTGPGSINRTRVVLSSVSKPEQKVVFFPADVAEARRASLPEGVVIERRGQRPATTQANRQTTPAK